MKKKIASLLLTALMCLTGMNAWALEQDGSGVYQIGTAQDLIDFAALVNGGTGGANAVLTADIDMDGKSYTPIGQDGKDYKGHFDGQGHRILNLTTNAGNNNQALFGQAVGGAIIENIIIDKSCKMQGAAFTAGILGHVWGDGVIVRNCGNEADIKGSAQNSAGIVGCSERVVTISNCYNTGSITGARENAGICGWMGSSSSVIENCFSIATGIDGEGMYRNTGASATNLYQIQGQQGTAFTNEQLTSGELCYLLNGKNPDGPWRQNIGTDNMPKPFGTEKVYANGSLRCDGQSLGGELTYSNASTSVIPPHTRDANTGFCTVCGAFFSDNFTPVDGYFVIDTPAKLFWFARYITEVDQKTNAKLTADIDYTAYKDNGFIGASQGKPFKGIFDGQGHKITVDLVDVYGRTGLFAYINAATIRDLEVTGTINMSTHNCAGGIGGRSDGDGTLIMNVVSSVTINDAQGGDGTIGGLFANMENKFTVQNCAFYGTINAPNRDGNGGLVGWAGGGSNGSFINCIVAPASISWKDGATIARNKPNINNCRATDAVPSNTFTYQSDATVASVTTAELSNPAFIFNTLNSVSTAPWRLTIGTDTKPYALSSHSIVYANGELRCDGTPIGGEITYSNVEAVIPDHTFGANGMCSVCNHAGAQPTLTDGVYQIANIGNLFWFSNFVNEGNTAANAALTADVEQGTVELQPIGNPSNLYSGTFDGKFNSVTLNMNNASSDYQGLFGAVTGGATFKNLIVKGSVKGKASVGGIVGGSTGGGTITFTNCGNEAEVTASGKNGAGLFGVNMLSAATVTFTNCYNTGDITSSGEGGAISGWIGDGSKGSAVTNCFNIGKITNGDFVRSNGGKLTNTYDKRNGEAEIASGELCYNLNGNQANIAFYQTIGTDAYPTLISSRGQVYRLEGPTYANTNEVDGVFQISNPYELIAFSKYVNAGNNSANGRLTADIDMKDVANFTPIGLFSDDPVYNPPTPSYNGTFDGNNHVIKNLTITLDEPYEAGLFSRCVGSSSVSNLGIIGANITSNAGIRTGVIAGLTSTKIRGCYTQDVTITTSNAQKGGIAGVFYTSGASPTKCYTTYETLGTMDSGAGADVSFAGSDVTTMGPTGELCWKLTDDSFKPTAAWRQNIGTDEYPTRDTSHGFVQKISAAGYATQSLAEDVTIPASMKAYAGKVNGQYMTLTEIENKIPANTGVVLEAAAGFYSFIPTTGAAAVADNDLVAAVEKVTKANIKGNYVLAVVDEVVGFYEATNAAALAAGKAYLPASAVTAGVKAVTFGTPTSLISPIEEKEEGAPVIYDLSGRRVEKATKGLYIINGKKILK